MQIDHIIPRIDKYGCGCGPNSPANALVISARLNGEMSNNTEHWARYELLQEHTLDPVAGKPTRPGDAEPVLDGPDDDHELGGCSTGGGAGGLVGFGVLGLAWSRRRRR